MNTQPAVIAARRNGNPKFIASSRPAVNGCRGGYFLLRNITSTRLIIIDIIAMITFNAENNNMNISLIGHPSFRGGHRGIVPLCPITTKLYQTIHGSTKCNNILAAF